MQPRVLSVASRRLVTPPCPRCCISRHNYYLKYARLYVRCVSRSSGSRKNLHVKSPTESSSQRERLSRWVKCFSVAGVLQRSNYSVSLRAGRSGISTLVGGTRVSVLHKLADRPWGLTQASQKTAQTIFLGNKAARAWR